MKKNVLFIIICYISIFNGFSQEVIPLLIGNEFNEIEFDKGEYPEIFDYTKRARKAQINPLLQERGRLEQGQKLLLNLFEDVKLEAEITKIGLSLRTFYIKAKIQDNPTSLVVISTTDKNTLVTIKLYDKNQVFLVLQDQTYNDYLVIEKNVAKMREELREKPDDTPETTPSQNYYEWKENDLHRLEMAKNKDTEEHATIDILVTYSNQANNIYRNNIENIVNNLFQESNDILENSQANLTLNVLQMQEINFDENIDSDGDANHDGVSDLYGMDEVRELRDEVGADLVVLLVSKGWDCSTNSHGVTYCVMGNAFGLRGTSTLADNSNIDHDLPKDRMAYSVSSVPASLNGFTMIHEIGHNLGAGHHKKQKSGDWWNPFDAGSQPGPQLFESSAGWLYQLPEDSSTGHVTIMSYRSPNQYESSFLPAEIVTLEKVPYFSNPNISHPATNQPLGFYDSNDSDDNAYNIKTIKETKHMVASYRPLSGIQDVYTDLLMTNNWNNVYIDIIAPEDGEYRINIWNSTGLWKPKWEWTPDYSGGLTPSVSSALVELNTGEEYTFIFQTKPYDESGTFRFNLHKKSGSIYYPIIDTYKTTLLTETPNAEIALCLDRSGSMGSNGYMIEAKNVSKLFVDLLEYDDYLAITSFSNSAGVNYSFTQITTEQNKSDAKNAINSISSGGGTGMGSGILKAQNELDKGNPGQVQTIILLGDGYENESPYVSEVLPNIPNNIDIYTIALGPDSDQTLLNNIAAGTGGMYSYSPGTDKLAAIYHSVQSKVSKQQMITLQSGQIAPNQEQTHNVPVDGGSGTVTFTMTGDTDELGFRLYDPYGQMIHENRSNPNIVFTSGESFKKYTITNPYIGNYTGIVDGLNVSQIENYDLIATGRSTLNMEVDFNKSIYGINEPILITAQFKDDTIPITDVSVSAEILVPNKGSSKSKKELRDEKSYENISLLFDKESGNYYDQKGNLYYYKSNLTLYDDGQHGDGDANDGIYGNYFTETNQQGSYTFDISAMGISNENGNFSRLLSVSTAVTSDQSISVTKPQTGIITHTYANLEIEWSSTNISGNVHILLSTDGGTSYSILASDIPDIGQYNLTIPNIEASDECRIKVQSIDYPSIYGENPGNFSIEKNTYFINANSGDHGMIDPEGLISVDHGQSIEFSITPDTGYHVSLIEIDSFPIDMNNHVDWNAVDQTFSFSNVIEDQSIFADFSINNYIVSYLSGANGSINGNETQSIFHGSSTTEVEAIPNDCHHFVHWSDGITDNPRADDNITADMEVTAIFAVDQFSVFYLSQENGQIIGSTTQTVDCSSSTTAVEAIPNDCHHFVHWSDGITDNPRTDDNITENMEITAIFAIDQFTLSYNADANGTISGEAIQTVDCGNDGSIVEAVANPGYVFNQWSDGKTENPRKDTSVYENIDVKAEFSLTTYTISLSVTPANAGGVNGGGQYMTGTTITVTASAFPSWQFSEWIEADSVVSRDENYTFEVKSNRDLIARFKPMEYEVTISAVPSNAGQISGEGVYQHGESVLISASPYENWEFLFWEDNQNNEQVFTSEHNFSVTSNRDFTAFFDKIHCNLDVIANPESGGTINGAGYIPCDTTTILVAIPATGYHFHKWTEGEDFISSNPILTITPGVHRSLTAYFVNQDYILLSEYELETGNETGFTNITVSSDKSWTANPDKSWLSLTPNFGSSGSTDVMISWMDNPTGEFREGSIVFGNEFIETSLILKQSTSTNNTITVSKEDVVIFPNPTTGFLNIQNMPVDAEVYFTDIRGMIIKRLEKSDKNMSIDLTGFNAGFYNLVIISSGNRWVKKVILF